MLEKGPINNQDDGDDLIVSLHNTYLHVCVTVWGPT